MVKNIIYSIIGLSVSSLSATAQTKQYTAANMHIHNDYEKPVPFWLAWHAGAGSMEADIFLKEGKLLVAHELKNISAGRTLETLYLKPIDSLIRSSSGFSGQHKNRKLQLLIDIKSEPMATLDSLVSLLKNYPNLIQSSNLKFVISGNRPPSNNFESYPNFIHFDGIPGQIYSAKSLTRIALFSDNFRKYAQWNGKGILTVKEKAKVDSVVSMVHALGKPIRFWNAPDTINAWYQFMLAGVDFINTDYPAECGTFFKQLPMRMFKNDTLQYALYKPTYQSDGINKMPKNIILLIGDGMGLAQLYAGYTANYGALNIFQLRQTGTSKTSSYDSYITDSAPGSTAFSSGQKTRNRSVGVDHTGASLPLLPKILKDRKGMATAIISCGDFTDATPADFYAHQAERTNSKPIAIDLEASGVDIVAGGINGSINHELKDLLPSYKIFRSLNEVPPNKLEKILIADPAGGRSILTGRGNWLSDAMDKCLPLLKKNDKGFFMMVEGAQIDYGGHANNLPYIVKEVFDFDKAVSKALAFADSNGETLIIITADHETGGLTLLDGDYQTGYVSGQFATNDHTAIPVPVYAYGPMSYLFTGTYENTEIFDKILQSLGLKK